MKTLVVTADDVGLHPGMTLGALKAHDEGIVTACSVVATGPALDDAVDRLRDRPGLDAGIHLTFVGERPLSPPERVRSLLGPDGAFLSGFRAFAARYVLGRIDDAELEAELRRQIERLLAAGLRLVHANSHQHLHILPRIFEIVLKLAEEYHIPWVRVPRDPAKAALSPRALEIGILNRIGRAARRQTNGRQVRTTHRTIGILDAGRLTPERLARLLRDVENVTELVCHPGIGDRELEGVYRWGYGWDGETAALCDPEVKTAIREGGIGLSGFSGVGR